jgi:DNA-3-methyladenine glycosylase I
MTDEAAPCPWVGDDPTMRRYHDEEWGVPLFDARRTFEFLLLETMQAGLSWRVVLHKREALREAFAGFDPERVAAFGREEVERMLDDERLIRHRGKLEAAIANARAFLALEEGPGVVPHLWSFVGGAPRQHRYRRMEDVPAVTPASEALAADLRRRGFRFVGPTVLYAHMQATGMVNDHLVSCPRHAVVARLAGARA